MNRSFYQKGVARHEFKYLNFLVKLHHASVAGYCQSAFCFQEVRSISKSPKKWLIDRSFSFHKAHLFSSECELMLKKVGAMIDKILMLLYLAHPFLGPRIGWFQKPLLARGADA